MPNNLKRTVRERPENSPRSNPNDRVPGEQASPISVQNLNIGRVAPWNVRQGEGVQPSLPFTPPIRLRKQPKGSRELRQLLPLTHQSREHRPPGGGPRAFSQAMNSGISYMGFLGDLISWLKVIKVFNPYFILFDYNGFHGTVWCQEWLFWVKMGWHIKTKGLLVRLHCCDSGSRDISKHLDWWHLWLLHIPEDFVGIVLMGRSGFGFQLFDQDLFKCTHFSFKSLAKSRAAWSAGTGLLGRSYGTPGYLCGRHAHHSWKPFGKPGAFKMALHSLVIWIILFGERLWLAWVLLANASNLLDCLNHLL